MIARQRLVLGLLLALASTPASAWADEEDEGGKATPRTVAGAFLEAFQKDDVAAMAKAAAPEIEPYPVVRWLLTKDLAKGAKVGDAKGPAAAARAYAAAVTGRPTAEGLREVVEAFASLDADGRERERRLATACAKARLAASSRDWKTAIDVARAAREDVEAAPGSLFATALQFAYAHALSDSGHEEESLAVYRDGAARSERMRWRHGRREALAGMAWAHYRAGRLEVCATAYEAWFAFSPPENDFAMRARIRLARVYSQTGRTASAFELLERARTAALAAGNRRHVALALAARASTRFEEGNLSAAIADADAAEAEARAAGDVRGAIFDAIVGAEFRAWLGRPAEAIAALEKARDGAVAGDDATGEAHALRSLAGVLLSLARSEAALSLLSDAARAYAKAGDGVGRSRVLTDRGRALVALGRHAEAREAFQEALAGREAAGDRTGTVVPRAFLGSVAVAEGRLEDAQALLSRAREDAATAGAFTVATVDGFLGELAEARGDLLAATAAYRAAVRGKEEGGGETFLAPSIGLARVTLARGDRAACVAAVRRALERRAGLSRGLSEDDVLPSRGVDRLLCDYGFVASWPRATAESTSADGGLGDSFSFAEQGRARILSEALAIGDATAGSGADARTSSEAARARAALEAARRRLQALSSTASVDVPAVERARSALDAAYVAEREAETRRRRSARRDARLADPEPTTLDAARKTLPEGSTLVLFHVGGGRLFAIAASAGRARGFELGEWKPIEEAVAGYVRIASTPDAPEEALARRLHALLVAPLLGELRSARRLVVVPDGALAFLPFEALLDDAPADAAKALRLAQRFEIAYVPSATVHDLLRSGGAREGQGVVALGDPVYPSESGAPSALALLRGAASLERLPASGDEARVVAAMFPAASSTVLVRDAATVDGLAAALSLRRERLAALHLACHGFLDAEHPALSGLVLSGGSLWTPDDVGRTRIPADLAVLSACETGGGRLAAGEGVMGLVRSFFHAGVPRVVVSDWAVSDASTLPFMRRFYEGIVKSGLAPSAALAAAKRAAIAEGGRAAHPSRWAGFVLWGLAD